jgi:AraC-like DNA-binding protein
MALSRTQLHRKIKALTNKTSSEFIRTIRLNKAAELLLQKTDNVTRIAYETGFNNLSWFAKAFKEQFGVRPSEYLDSNKS